MTKILITGANGLIAQAIIRKLQTSAYSLYCTSLNKQSFTAECVYRQANIVNEAEFVTVADECNPDVIIHCAALSKPDECEKNKQNCWEINVAATSYIVNYCKKTGVYLIYFSSDFVYTGTEAYYSEEDEAVPVSLYGNSKLESERMIQSELSEYAIIRTSLVYGCVENNLRSNFVLWVKNSLSRNNAIKVVADQYRTPTYDEDIANAIEVMIERKSVGIYNIAGKDYIAVYDLALETARAFDLDIGLIEPVMTQSLNEPAKRPVKTYLKIDKAYRDLLYTPCSLTEGLQALRNRLDKCIL